MLNFFLRNTLIAAALTSGILSASYTDYNSVIVQPLEMIMHIDQAYLIDANGLFCPLLQSPMNIDIAQDHTVDLMAAINLARNNNMTPVKLVIQTRRYFEVLADVILPNKDLYAHTKTNSPEITYEGISHICMASQTNEPPTTQKCWVPESDGINDELNALNVEAGKNGVLLYTVDLSAITSSTQKASLLIHAGSVEFGTDINERAVVVMAHLPVMALQLPTTTTQVTDNLIFESKRTSKGQFFNEKAHSIENVRLFPPKKLPPKTIPSITREF